MDRVRNEEVRSRCGLKVSIDAKIERNILRWYGHVQRMGNERAVRRVYEAEVEGRRPRGRPRLRWRDGVLRAVEGRGVDMDVAGELVRDRGEWRRFVRAGVV